MLIFNPYIVNNQETMCKFLDEIAVTLLSSFFLFFFFINTFFQVPIESPAVDKTTEEQKNEALQNVVKHIVMSKEKIRKIMEKQQQVLLILIINNK